MSLNRYLKSHTLQFHSVYQSDTAFLIIRGKDTQNRDKDVSLPPNFKKNRMFIVITLMLAGILAGWLLRGRRIQVVRRAITPLIWLLLFLLGVEVGGNERIIRSLHALGLEALLIAVGATLGSVLAAWGLWKAVAGRGKEAGHEG